LLVQFVNFRSNSLSFHPVTDKTTCDRVVLDLLFLRRTCRFFVLCL
ncbi:hypothetical protein T05_5228, partial [Trichinella murrelli]